MDNAKLFHFDKKALRDECIKRGEIIERLECQLALIAKAIHYPGCWDTAAHPNLLGAAREIGCNPFDCVAGGEE